MVHRSRSVAPYYHGSFEREHEASYPKTCIACFYIYLGCTPTLAPAMTAMVLNATLQPQPLLRGQSGLTYRWCADNTLVLVRCQVPTGEHPSPAA